MDAINKACAAIGQADGLLIMAGAGLSVDSGLPDFRGQVGFWNAYPALQVLKLHAWQQNTARKLGIGLGAGFDVPTIRIMSERQEGRLIRINPLDCAVPDNGIGTPLGVLEALQQISTQVAVMTLDNKDVLP